MKKSLCLLYFLFSVTAYSYIPSLESLLRNSNNIDIEKKHVVAHVLIKKEVDGRGIEFFATKIFINNSYENRKQICQVVYKNGVFNKSNIGEVKCFSNQMIKKMELKEELIKNKMFYSLMMMLLNNSSQEVMSLIKSLDTTVSTNKEIINKTQSFYLNQYAEFLKNEEEGENPLQPTDPEAKERVSKVMEEPFYGKANNVQRIKIGNSFYLKFMNDYVEALFANDSHRLLKLKLKWASLSFDIMFKNYLLVGGSFETAETVQFSDQVGAKYEIRIKKVFTLDETASQFNRRISKLKKEIQKTSDLKKSDLLL